MQIHSDAYLDQLIAEQEAELSRKTRAIFNRFELAITAGQSKYQLPDNIFTVIEVAWRGEVVHNMEISDYNSSSWYKPNNLANQSATPDFHMLSNYGYKTIQFHPIPSTAYALTGGNLYTKSGYNAAIVISCYRVADSSSDEFRLRTRMLRNIIKYRAMQRAYLKEGKGHDLAASSYFANKANWIEDKFVEVCQKIPKALLSDDSADLRPGRGKIPRPQLPTTGPWSF